MVDQAEQEEMQRAIAMRKQRRDKFEQDGERPLWKNLSMIGALGWLIVVPIVAGALVGSWLDARLHTGITFSGAMILIGAVAGSYLAWKRVDKS